jgi:uncharacterized membrane-anchored protein YjiN (DUF445 family)
MNKVNDVELLYDYFISHSHLDPTNTYANNVAQNGTGVGNFLGGLIRSILPIIRKTSMVIGSELVKNSVTKLNNELMQNHEVKNRKVSCTKRKSKSILETSDKKKARINSVKSNLTQNENPKKKTPCINKIKTSFKKSSQSSGRSQRSKLSLNKKKEKVPSKKTKLSRDKCLKQCRKVKNEKDIFSDI